MRHDAAPCTPAAPSTGSELMGSSTCTPLVPEIVRPIAAVPTSGISDTWSRMPPQLMLSFPMFARIGSRWSVAAGRRAPCVGISVSCSPSQLSLVPPMLLRRGNPARLRQRAFRTVCRDRNPLPCRGRGRGRAAEPGRRAARPAGSGDHCRRCLRRRAGRGGRARRWSMPASASWSAISARIPRWWRPRFTRQPACRC